MCFVLQQKCYQREFIFAFDFLVESIKNNSRRRQRHTQEIFYNYCTLQCSSVALKTDTRHTCNSTEYQFVIWLFFFFLLFIIETLFSFKHLKAIYSCFNWNFSYFKLDFI